MCCLLLRKSQPKNFLLQRVPAHLMRFVCILTNADGGAVGVALGKLDVAG